jgi:hypothetical protein
LTRPGGPSTLATVSKPESPYRAPSPSRKALARSAPDDDGLDASAFQRKQDRRQAIEARADEERVALASRQLRMRAGLAFGLGAAALALAAPALSEPHVRVRGVARLVILGGALLGYAGYTLFAGTGGSESVDRLPRQVVAGQVVAAVIGATLGALALWLR